MYKVNFSSKVELENMQSFSAYRERIAMEIEVLLDNELRILREQNDMMRSYADELADKNGELLKENVKLKKAVKSDDLSCEEDQISDEIAREDYDALATTLTTHKDKIKSLESQLESLTNSYKTLEKREKSKTDENKQLRDENATISYLNNANYTALSYDMQLRRSRIQILQFQGRLSVAERAELSFLLLDKDRTEALEMSKKNKMAEVKKELSTSRTMFAGGKSSTERKPSRPSVARPDVSYSQELENLKRSSSSVQFLRNVFEMKTPSGSMSLSGSASNDDYSAVSLIERLSPHSPSVITIDVNVTASKSSEPSESSESSCDAQKLCFSPSKDRSMSSTKSTHKEKETNESESKDTNEENEENIANENRPEVNQQTQSASASASKPTWTWQQMAKKTPSFYNATSKEKSKFFGYISSPGELMAKVKGKPKSVEKGTKGTSLKVQKDLLTPERAKVMGKSPTVINSSDRTRTSIFAFR